MCGIFIIFSLYVRMSHHEPTEDEENNEKKAKQASSLTNYLLRCVVGLANLK
jgi:hypothetical protein